MQYPLTCPTWRGLGQKQYLQGMLFPPACQYTSLLNAGAVPEKDLEHRCFPTSLP